MVDETPPTGERPAPTAHGSDIYTIANVITILRLVLVPFFFAVLITENNDMLAFFLFAIAASTDWLDGQIARRTGTVTPLGAAIDPLVDRLLIASGVVGLYMVGRLPLWIPIVLVARDAYLLWGAWRLEHHFRRRLAVTFAGKTTTALLLGGFSLLILNWPMLPGLGVVESSALPGWGEAPAALGIWFVWTGLALSIGTATQYTIRASRIARGRPVVTEGHGGRDT